MKTWRLRTLTARATMLTMETPPLKDHKTKVTNLEAIYRAGSIRSDRRQRQNQGG